MRFILSLAVKNLARHRRRTVITSAAIAVGIMFFIILDALLLGIEVDSERNLIGYESGTAQIMTRERFAEIRELPLSDPIEEPAVIAAALDGVGVAHTPLLSFYGEVFFGEGSLPVKLIGIDPTTHSDVFLLEEALQRTVTPDQPNGGVMIEPGSEKALLGAWLADDLNVTVGDWLVVRTRTRYGAIQTIDLEVAGVFSSPNPVINKGTAYLPIDTAIDALETDGAVTEIAVALPGLLRTEEQLTRALAGVTDAVTASGPRLGVFNWRALGADYLAIATAKQGGTKGLLSLIFIIAAVGISNTMLLAVYERTREIGMMRAMGMSDRGIRRAMVIEAGMIGLIGSIAGVILGALANIFLVDVGIDYSALLGRASIGYRIFGVFRSAWNPDSMVAALFAGTIAAMVIAVVPANRALRTQVVEALRAE